MSPIEKEEGFVKKIKSDPRARFLSYSGHPYFSIYYSSFHTIKNNTRNQPPLTATSHILEQQFKMWWNKKQPIESTRYFYSDKDQHLFEKSLDVYKPILDSNSTAKDNKEEELPVVILVVGSCWVGHRAFVYAGTSWWNSSGPKTVASLGTTCVCIRHRGAFCVLPDIATIGQCLALVFALSCAGTGGQWQLALLMTAMVALMLALFAVGGKGAAKFEDMLEDVAEALCWIDNNKHVLRIHSKVAEKEEQQKLLSKSPSDASATAQLRQNRHRQQHHRTTGCRPFPRPTVVRIIWILLHHRIRLVQTTTMIIMLLVLPIIITRRKSFPWSLEVTLRAVMSPQPCCNIPNSLRNTICQNQKISFKAFS